MMIEGGGHRRRLAHRVELGRRRSLRWYFAAGGNRVSRLRAGHRRRRRPRRRPPRLIPRPIAIGVGVKGVEAGVDLRRRRFA